jgi:hypothetical protein
MRCHRFVSIVTLAALSAATPSHAGTDVSGITTTQTWTIMGSPYRVIDDVIVPASDTLSIEPGVEIAIDAGTSLEVYGRLDARGEPGDSIRINGGPVVLRGGVPSSMSHVVMSAGDGTILPGYGGGLLVEGSILRAEGCVIQGYARDGGRRSTGPTLDDGIRACGGGIAVRDRSNVTLVDCVVRDNYVLSATITGMIDKRAHFFGLGGGIYADGVSWVTLVRCLVTRNRADSGGAGIYAVEATIVADNCYIVDNTLTTFGNHRISRYPPNVVGGIALSCGETSILRNCTIAGNRVDTAYSPLRGVVLGPCRMESSIVWDNDQYLDTAIVAAYCDVEDSTTVFHGEDNIHADPLFVDATHADYTVLAGSPCIDIGDPAAPLDGDGTRADIGVSTNSYTRPIISTIGSLVVPSNGSASLPITNSGNLTLTIASIELPTDYTVVEGFPLHIAAGGDTTLSIEYAGTDVFLTSGSITSNDPIRPIVDLSLQGRSANRVIGEIGTITWVPDLSPYRVIGAASVAAGEILTIEPGVDVLFDEAVPLKIHGRLVAIGTLEDSIRFAPGNAATWDGLRIDSGDSSTISFGVITGGKTPSGGGLHVTGTNTRVRISNSSIRGNIAHYLAATIDGWFSRGTGGAAHISDGAVMYLDSCLITDNGAWEPGTAFFVTDGGMLHATTCIFTGNDVYWEQLFGPPRTPGVVYAGNGAFVSIESCTFTGNNAPGLFPPGSGFQHQTAVLRLYNGTATVRNTILVDNMDGTGMNLAVWDEGGSTVNVEYSCTTAEFPGTGNIVADPLFASIEGQVLNLQPDSPCIDAGDPALSDPDGSRSDMGAIPFNGTTSENTSDAIPLRFSLEQNAPNPFNPTTSIAFTLSTSDNAKLAIYDITGRHVQTLLQQHLDAGVHSVMWDGTDTAGRHVASGVYLYRLIAGKRTMVRRLSVVR